MNMRTQYNYKKEASQKRKSYFITSAWWKFGTIALLYPLFFIDDSGAEFHAD